MKKFLISLLFMILFISCQKAEGKKMLKQKKTKITLEAEFKLKVPEPSGLTLNKNGLLVTVSDKNSKVYWLDKKGEIKKEIKIKGKDLEGITFLDKNTLAAVSESERKIYIFNENGKEIYTKKFDFEGRTNSGFEGIAYNKTNGHFFIVNEKFPKTLIETDESLKIIKKNEIDFCDDLSGLFYDFRTNFLWIVSDESKLIAKSTTKGELLEKFHLKIPQMEGIAVDSENNRIYIVSDKKEKLYVFSISEK